jgi:hypothetical protein
MLTPYMAYWAWVRNTPIPELRDWYGLHTDTWASVTLTGHSHLVGDVRQAVRQVLDDADRGIAQIPYPL